MNDKPIWTAIRNSGGKKALHHLHFKNQNPRTFKIIYKQEEENKKENAG